MRKVTVRCGAVFGCGLGIWNGMVWEWELTVSGFVGSKSAYLVLG